ncbi:hypothetical protein DV738_g5332, partial [Chaetothyriales sp. CBS 135597]
MPRRLGRNDYTVGWVCALPIELTAARVLLDEEHDDLPRYSNDTNIYTLGSIGKHNVVLTCLPAGQTGTNSATVLAIQMRHAFPAIQFGLMVGIGGGVPSAEADIRLGDVVVSQPANGHGGVVQYDLIKSTPSGVKRTGFLNAPPPILLSAVSKLRSNHALGRSGLSVHLAEFKKLPLFNPERAGEDILFVEDYNHVRGNDCTLCDTGKRRRRKVRAVEMPEIHYGTIASGNQLVRDSVTRKHISSECGEVLCFEMEGAGIMNDFPCLVIRGISDYADSHKNKRWQPYAAGTAAAYAKELLLVIPAAEVDQNPTDDDATRLASLHEMEVGYQVNRQVKEAVALLERVAKMWEQTLTESHLDQLASQHALSGVSEVDGQVKEALALLHRVVEIPEQTLA